jgi:hypothetical protein
MLAPPNPSKIESQNYPIVHCSPPATNRTRVTLDVLAAVSVGGAIVEEDAPRVVRSAHKGAGRPVEIVDGRVVWPEGGIDTTPRRGILDNRYQLRDRRNPPVAVIGKAGPRSRAHNLPGRWTLVIPAIESGHKASEQCPVSGSRSVDAPSVRVGITGHFTATSAGV